jgi:hypothetical protein
MGESAVCLRKADVQDLGTKVSVHGKWANGGVQNAALLWRATVAEEALAVASGAHRITQEYR